ncbi:hypothetical protein [Hydrogenivirga sp. 128-5-R1-1]|uniref:hypothetical protein n=1 Tax=Hydrogenivirga sp. 128-5-R1-1 TaxID=392423 RepID=UPI00015EF7E1|nr:hypothetical protein [Hydrogenivirga sp. 128-5-R1-1]EDP74930.1 hypothetical protein HG1285_13717 [Hydrogenivirga sp. 128-5-R1-1]
MVLLLLVLVSLSFSELLDLSTEENEGAFGIKDMHGWFCFVGRRSSEENGYDALLGVCDGTCKAYSVGSARDDYSYSVESTGNLCLAGVTTLAKGDMDFLLVTFGREGVEETVSMGGEGNDMLWFLRRVEGGYLLVGGVQDEDWDILVVKLNDGLLPVWVRRLGTEFEEYAYGVVEWRGKYYVVGRSNYRGNWDAFVLELSPRGRLLSSKLIGSGSKDYLRYVGLFRGEPLAVGRSETNGDSDVLLFSPRSGLCRLYDGGEFDYGRVFSEDRGRLLLMGDTYGRTHSDGLLLVLDGEFEVVKAYSIGGEDVESVRYLDGRLFAGYTYSFTLDNDVLLGRVGDSCASLVREVPFRRREGRLEFYRYPLEERDYAFRLLDLGVEVRSIRLKEMEPCQE